MPQAPRKPCTELAGRVGVEVGQRVAPRLRVGRHRLVMPAIGLSFGQPRIDHLQHRHSMLTRLTWITALVEQLGEQCPCYCLLGRAEEPRIGLAPEPSDNGSRCNAIPLSGLGEHVKTWEPWFAVRRFDSRLTHRSRRKIEARRPIPPTIVTSNGANNGGPISML